MWPRAADMKLLYFMLLLIFGAISSDDYKTSGKKEVMAETTKKSECIFHKLMILTTETDVGKIVCDCSIIMLNINEIKFNSAKLIGPDKVNINANMKLQFDGPTITCDHGNFHITVVKMDMMDTTDQGHVKISAPKVSDDDPPIDVFIPSEPFLNVSMEQRRVGVVTYRSAQQFTNNSNTVLKSKVICVETLGLELKNLSNLLVIKFTVNSSEIIPGTHTLSCQFYNITEQKWDDMGSFTNLSNFNSSNTVTCSYNHMTPFAVLLVDMNVLQIDRVQWKILSYVSYIGCSLSLFFSAVTILLYICTKSSNKDSSMGIHVSLSVALFLLNASFLFIEWGATWSQKSACVLIAVIIQYSLLSCFSWMAIEAIHLYFLLIKVFNTHFKHYMVKLSLFGWGVPVVLVGGSLCVYGSKPFYGTTETKLSGTNETMQFCWITEPHFLYGMNITYFCLMFLFNTSILLAVTHQIFKMPCLDVQESKRPSYKDICTVLGLTVLLGMTWGLAFFTAGYTNYPILYLFCICNTLQGLFLFLWFYGTMKKNRCPVAQTSTLSEPCGSTMNTYENRFTH
ncbi:adhesion G protein-coupled receptor G3 isoform X2 [Ictalurus furcatus]|uniref:adhesion G protein-coupled receptor G3 isoform X2 n=1 Tax=Ictalurus furcatus TaxID=66913 RepID=UPI0023503928|nr:adhesion G protein-coupled receptor G3 isoform X2 [Ictalurus furcatus]